MMFKDVYTNRRSSRRNDGTTRWASRRGKLLKINFPQHTHTIHYTHTQSRLVLSKESWPYMASHVMASRVAASHFNAARPYSGTASVYVL